MGKVTQGHASNGLVAPSAVLDPLFMKDHENDPEIY